MKNNIIDCISKTWRTNIVPLLAMLLLLTGCEMESDMDLPLAVNANALTLTSDAGSTQVQIYSTGQWTTRLSEHVDWATISNLRGTGNSSIAFKYAANYGITRAVDIIFAHDGEEEVIRMTQEGKAPNLSLEESRMEIFSNPWNVQVALKNNLEEAYKTITDTVVYSVIAGEDDDEAPAPDEQWIDQIQVSTDALSFLTKENTSTRNRKAVITLRYIDVTEKLHTTSLTITQSTKAAYMRLMPDRAKVTRKAATVKAEVEHNMGRFLSQVVCTPSYEGASTNWIEPVTFEDNTMSFNVLPNDSEAPRTASILFSLPTATQGTLTPSAPFVVDQSFESDYRTLITAESGEIKISNDKAFFEGIVISDAGNPNLESALNTAPNASDLTRNDKTAYVQITDGSYGYRLQFEAESDNALARYSFVKISLNGLTLTKEANPTRYTLSGLTAANIVSQTPGKASDLLVKKKAIGELTDEDVYTFVSLQNVEFTLPDGSYTNVNEGYYGKGDFTSCVPRALYDNDGHSLHMLVNNKVSWRRSGDAMPKGNGTLSGVIVHDLQPRFGYTNEGFIGRYSVRVLAKEDIVLRAASKRQTLVEWNWEDGVIKKNDNQTLAPNTGEGALWCTDPTAVCAIDNEYNGVSTSAQSGKRALRVNDSYWWNFEANEGYAVALQFSTVGAGENLSLNFTNSQGNAGPELIYGPIYWQIEYSTDGTNFTLLPESTFCARPFAFWKTTMSYCATAGYADRLFWLPDALRNQPAVTLHIKAKSTQCIESATATVAEGDTGVITAGMDPDKRSPMRFGTISIKSNK